jgi:hypothetical protein
MNATNRDSWKDLIALLIAIASAFVVGYIMAKVEVKREVQTEPRIFYECTMTATGFRCDWSNP